MTSIKQKVSVLSLLADVMECKDHENFERQGLNGKTNIFTLDKSTTEITNIIASLFVHSFDSICDNFTTSLCTCFDKNIRTGLKVILTKH